MELKQAVKPLSRTLMLASPLARHLSPVIEKLAPSGEPFLQKSFADTYWRLRAVMAIVAFAFPVAIPLAGKWLYGIPYANSLSAYYFATPVPEIIGGEPRMRVWFFGGLLTLGVCLFSYKGYSKLEDRLLTLAGACAIGVAVCPMPWPSGSGGWLSLHYVFAMLLFVFLTWVCVGCSQQTLKEADAETRDTFEPLYYLTGFGMLSFPATAWIWTRITGTQGAHVFWMELFGIWTFGIFWVLKNAELRSSSAEDGSSTEMRAVTNSVSGSGLPGPKK